MDIGSGKSGRVRSGAFYASLRSLSAEEKKWRAESRAAREREEREAVRVRNARARRKSVAARGVEGEAAARVRKSIALATSVAERDAREKAEQERRKEEEERAQVLARVEAGWSVSKDKEGRGRGRGKGKARREELLERAAQALEEERRKEASREARVRLSRRERATAAPELLQAELRRMVRHTKVILAPKIVSVSIPPGYGDSPLGLATLEDEGREVRKSSILDRTKARFMPQPDVDPRIVRAQHFVKLPSSVRIPKRAGSGGGGGGGGGGSGGGGKHGVQRSRSNLSLAPLAKSPSGRSLDSSHSSQDGDYSPRVSGKRGRRTSGAGGGRGGGGGGRSEKEGSLASGLSIEVVAPATPPHPAIRISSPE